MAVSGDATPDRGMALEGSHVRWSGVWTGFLIAMGVLVLLSALGVAVGATAAASGNARVLGAGAAWWGGISFLVALFLGGAVASRSVTGSLAGVLQGSLVWVLSMAAVILLAGFGVSLGSQGLLAAVGTPSFGPAAAHVAFDLVQAGGQVGTTGTVNVAGGAESAAWITFIVLCASAIAAIVGALVGRQDERLVRRTG